MVILLIRGSILEVTGYRNPPNPCVVILVLFFWFWDNDVPGKYLGVGFLDSVKLTFPDTFDMFLLAFDIFSQYLVMALLTHQAIIAVTVTDSGNCN
jgi:hypothetical protein